MSGELQVDIDALNAFAQRMSYLATNYAKNAVPQPPPSVNFGQAEVNGFKDAQTLAGQYQTKASDLVGCYQTFLAELQQLANAATALSKKYQAAASDDVVSAKDVDDAIGPLPNVNQTGTGR